MGRRAQALAGTRARSLRQGMAMQRGREETDLSSIVLLLLGALLASCSRGTQPVAVASVLLPWQAQVSGF